MTDLSQEWAAELGNIYTVSQKKTSPTFPTVS